MQFRKTLSLGTLALAFAVGACGDSTGSNSISMTQAEAGEIFSQVFSSALTAAFQSNGSATALSAGITASCDGGGSALVKGTSTATTDNLTIAFTACHSTPFIIDGSVTFNETISGTNETTTVTGDLAISGSKTGNCHIDVTVKGTTNSSAGTSSGSICGVDASGVSASRVGL